MKKLIVMTCLLLLSTNSFAKMGGDSCAPLFEDLITAKESIVFAPATNFRMQMIEPTTRDLELYDGGSKKEVKVGDYVSITFKEPIISDMPTTTGSIDGYMLGSRKMIDPKTGEAKLYYFVMNPTFTADGRTTMHAILAFPLENVEPFESQVRRDLGYKYRDNYN